MGTDGLYDNLNEEQIKTMLEKNYLKKKFNPREFTQLLIREAFTLSLNETYDSPFSKAAKVAKRNY